jgi:integrase/recombinase XerD
LEQFTRFLEPTPLLQARPDDIEQFLACKRAARTRHAYRSDLRVFYQWAVDKGLLQQSPAAKVAQVKVPKSLPRPLSVAEAMGALLHGERRVRRMVALALFCGLRCHEIAGLHAEDVWLHGEPPVIVVRHGKGNKDRTIPLHPMVRDLLLDLPASGPVFPGCGRPTMRPASIGQAIKHHLELTGIVGTPHQLRHTFGTELARASGGDMVLTATLMGHESMSTTMSYVRLTAGRAGDVISTMFLPPAA